MSDFWTALGCCCVDADFHKKCFSYSNPNPSNFSDLLDLRRLLCKVSGLRLERGEVWELNHILRWRYRKESGTEKYARVELNSLDEDLEIKAIRDLWSFDNGTLPADCEMFSVIGLAAMDGQFLDALAGAGGSFNALKGLLTEGDDDESPLFTLSAGTLLCIQEFITANKDTTTMRQALIRFEAAAWVLRMVDGAVSHDNTFFNGCGRSFSFKPQFRGLPEQAIVNAVQNHPTFMSSFAKLLLATQGQFTKKQLQALFDSI